MCIINDNHMRYGSWDMEHNKHNFFHFDCFLLFYPTNNRKIKILKKWKKPWVYNHFTQGTKTHDHMLHYSSDTTRGRCNFYISFWAILFPFYPFNNPKNHFFKKREKHLDIPSFYTCVPKVMMITWYNFSWDMVHNGWTDRKSDI